MNAKDSATIHISHSTVYNTINHVTYGSETKITSMMTSSRETRKGAAEIPRVNPIDSPAKSVHWPWASPMISHRKVSSELSFTELYRMLIADLRHTKRRSVLWQESKYISRMQAPSEWTSSLAAIAQGDRRIVPLLDWRLVEGPIGNREQMERYAKRDPLFVGSLSFPKSRADNWDLDRILAWLSNMIVNIQRLCTKPMLLITLDAEIFYVSGKVLAPNSFGRIGISIIETGHTTRIPRYQSLHDPTRPRPPTFPPPRSVPVSTANPSSSDNKQLVPKKQPQPKFGPKPPSVPPLPNVKPESRVSRIPRHKDTFYRPAIPSSSSKELTISQRLDELTRIVKRQEVLLENVAGRLG
ncbi:hypothetical protein BDN72DRAFT_947877 [Pluteus cervinus]|uniref:Uncharacterized protein n=1 Tax=Pluteus cervinus TaxID=181527 RepID=A0ACD3A0X2_9AGAR|nr:hypothetical protein BDN72DRAFT_947877 [Pluteus cervinus]